MANPLSPQTLVYGFTTAADPQVAPDGTRVVYTLASTDAETKKTSSQLWMCAVDGSGARRLTWTGTRNHSARWSPDGRALAFVSDRVEANGLFLLPMEDGGEARELTKQPAAIHDVAWSPDGLAIAFVSSFDPANPEATKPAAGAPAPIRVTSRLDYKQDNRGYLDNNRMQVFVTDVGSGETRRVTSVEKDHAGPTFSPDGTALLYRTVWLNGKDQRLWIQSLDGAEPRQITGADGVVSTWAWSPSGTRVLYTGDPDHSYQPEFFVYEVGSGETRQVTSDLACLPDGGFPTIQPPSQPTFLDEEHVLFHAFQAAASGLFVLDLRDGSVAQVEGEQELRAGFSCDNEGRTVAQAMTSLERIGEIAVVDRTNGGRAVVTSYSAPVFEASPPARWERFDISRSGYTIDAWLLLPADFDASKRYPLVLDVHGGPNGYYGYGFNAIQQCLATNGIAVVYSNPRGSSSYGREFTQQVIGDWGGEDYLDLMAVMDRALERPYFDEARTGIWGYSYGGYMTARTIAQNHRFKAAVCGAPCFDLESMFGTSDISHFFGPLQWTGAPHEAREWYATHSPSQTAHNTRTPTLLIHGEADERCPIGQGEQMFVTLKKAGCDVEFARYPGQSHLFLRTGPPEYRLDVLARTLGWFKRHLGEPV